MQSDLEDDTPQIRTLIMSCFPGFVEKQNYTFNPTPPITQYALLPATLIILVIACIGATAIIRRRKRK